MFRRFVLSLCFVLLFGFSAFGQQEQEEVIFPNLPYYSFGSGLGLTTPDSTFRLNIRFRMQNRIEFRDDENSDPAIDATIRRLRLRFDGFVGDPRFLYVIQLSFAPGDVGRLVPGENLNVIRDAVMFYVPNPNWNIGFGQTKLPGNRQRVNSSGALQLTDRSINNAVFTIDRDLGLFANYQHMADQHFSYAVRTAITTGNGRNWQANSDTKLSYTGRIEILPFGNFDTLFEGDLKREERLKLLLGATYSFNHGAQKERGQTGSRLEVLRDIRSFHADVMMKYQGWAFQSAYLNRRADEPIVLIPDGTFNNVPLFKIDPVQTGYGMDFQLSYLFPTNYELIGRYSFQRAERNLPAIIYWDQDQYSFGVTRYIWEHALKLQIEGTYTMNYFPLMDSFGSWYGRFQVEIGI